MSIGMHEQTKRIANALERLTSPQVTCETAEEAKIRIENEVREECRDFWKSCVLAQLTNSYRDPSYNSYDAAQTADFLTEEYRKRLDSIGKPV